MYCKFAKSKLQLRNNSRVLSKYVKSDLVGISGIIVYCLVLYQISDKVRGKYDQDLSLWLEFQEFQKSAFVLQNSLLLQD